MELHLHIPDTVAAVLHQRWAEADIPHHALEDLVVQWYQQDILTEDEVRLALGLDTRMQVHALLKARAVSSHYTLDDFAADLAAHDALDRACGS